MSTYDNNLRLEEIGTGERTGSWGTATNTNLELIGYALGYATKNCFDTDADKTLTVADANVPGDSEGRALFIKVTATDSSTTLSQARALTIAPNTMKRVHFIHNAASDTHPIIIKQGGGNGSTVSIPAGATKVVYLDGTGTNANVVDAFSALSAGVVKASGDTAAGDAAAIGYTATEGLILTGQGTTNDVTIKNDADADVAKIPTGTTDFDIAAHDGSSTGLKLGGTLVTATAADLNASGNATTTGKAIAMAIVFG
jgi:hypothetical protein